MIIYTDCHWGSPIGLENIYNLFVKERLREDVFAIGDNYDLANCSRSSVEVFNGMMFFAKQAMGERMIYGNHERSSSFNETIKVGGAILVHGDFEAWGADRAVKYRSGPHGSSEIKRKLIPAANAYYDTFVNSKYDQEFFDRCEKKCKYYGVKTIIMGHRHPKKTKIFDVNGIKIIVLPRGRSVIDF